MILTKALLARQCQKGRGILLGRGSFLTGRRTGKDVSELVALLDGVEGQRCWQAAVGYANEVILDFGARVPAGGGHYTGEWGFSSGGSDWVITDTDGNAVLSQDLLTEASSGDRARLAEKLHRFQEQVLARLSIGKDLKAVQLVFGSGDILQIHPPPPEPDEDDIPDWEMVLPSKTVVEVGPGYSWREIRAEST